MKEIKNLTLDSIIEQAQNELNSQTSKKRFRLPINTEVLKESLAIAFNKGVTYRGGTFISDVHTMTKIEKVAGWLSSLSAKPMLLLSGNRGAGKSEMARSIEKLITALGEGARSLEQQNGSWITTSQENKEQARLFKAITDLPKPMIVTAQQLVTFATKESPEYDRAKKTPILIVDDLGAEPSNVKVYGSDYYPIVDLINERYDKMSTTVFTTNLSMVDISNYYGDRIADRLTEVCEVLIYSNDSYRNRQKHG